MDASHLHLLESVKNARLGQGVAVLRRALLDCYLGDEAIVHPTTRVQFANTASELARGESKM